MIRALITSRIFSLVRPIRQYANRGRLIRGQRRLFFCRQTTFRRGFTSNRGLATHRGTERNVVRRVTTFYKIVRSLPTQLTIYGVVPRHVRITLSNFFTSPGTINDLLFIRRATLRRCLLSVRCPIWSVVGRDSFSFLPVMARRGRRYGSL